VNSSRSAPTGREDAPNDEAALEVLEALLRLVFGHSGAQLTQKHGFACSPRPEEGNEGPAGGVRQRIPCTINNDISSNRLSDCYVF
jgi:hypothetical protein